MKTNRLISLVAALLAAAVLAGCATTAAPTGGQYQTDITQRMAKDSMAG